MSDVVIAAENLGKSFLIGHQVERERERYTALRDVLTRAARNSAAGAWAALRGRQLIIGDDVEEFWALKDVSFTVDRGEVVGIVGRNGAGKSTLLKVLSRITEPTRGRVTIKGRVASLLEVGTGFHPELTGRENIYLNGSILGMTRAEIRAKFDEIVAFAQIERFLDTPVKRFSSGMYVRLAFSVAAHLEPEILVVDEVLAVGDADFQKKCLGKMKDVATGGRTVLFVSHNMAAVQSLCQKGILLSAGRVAKAGSIAGVVAEYTRVDNECHHVNFEPRPDQPTITAITIDRNALREKSLIVDIAFESPEPISTPIGGLNVSSLLGQQLWGTNARFHHNTPPPRPVRSGTLRCVADSLPLMPGSYAISVWLGDRRRDYDSKREVLQFEFGTENYDADRPSVSLVGHVDWPAKWQCEVPDAAPIALAHTEI